MKCNMLQDVIKDPYSSNQAYEGFNGELMMWDSDDDTSSQGTLDSIIPAPDTFDGSNNPFLFYEAHKKKVLKHFNLLSEIYVCICKEHVISFSENYFEMKYTVQCF